MHLMIATMERTAVSRFDHLQRRGFRNAESCVTKLNSVDVLQVWALHKNLQYHLACAHPKVKERLAIMTIQMTAIQSSIDSSRQEFAVEKRPLVVPY